MIIYSNIWNDFQQPVKKLFIKSIEWKIECFENGYEFTEMVSMEFLKTTQTTIIVVIVTMIATTIWIISTSKQSKNWIYIIILYLFTATSYIFAGELAINGLRSHDTFSYHWSLTILRIQSNNASNINNQMMNNSSDNNNANVSLNIASNICQTNSNIDITLSNTVHELNVLTSVLNSQMQLAVQQQQQVSILTFVFIIFSAIG